MGEFCIFLEGRNWVRIVSGLTAGPPNEASSVGKLPVGGRRGVGCSPYVPRMFMPASV